MGADPPPSKCTPLCVPGNKPAPKEAYFLLPNIATWHSASCFTTLGFTCRPRTTHGPHDAARGQCKCCPPRPHAKPAGPCFDSFFPPSTRRGGARVAQASKANEPTTERTVTKEQRERDNSARARRRRRTGSYSSCRPPPTPAVPACHPPPARGPPGGAGVPVGLVLGGGRPCLG